MRNFNFSDRRNRDRPSGQADVATDFMDSALAWPESGWNGAGKPAQPSRVTKARAQPEPQPDSVEAVVAKGHRWLVFPAALEAAFQAETAHSRRLMQLACTLVGIPAFWVGTMNGDRLVPDLADLHAQSRVLILLLMVCSLGASFLFSVALRKSWHVEALTMVNTLAVNFALVLVGMLSSETTAMTHTQCVVLVVMYAGLAARQRFWWTFSSAGLTVVAYVALVRGSTPLQQLIVDQNIKLMVVAFAYTLVPNYAFEYGERRAWLLRQLDAKRRTALLDTSERLSLLSQRDPLTGLHNRRHVEVALQAAWRQARASGQPLAALMIDVDQFKLYNDTHGHPAGDACLERIAGVLEAVAQREQGVAARLGGEEFAVLLPGRSADEALAVAEALCRAVRDLCIEHQASQIAPHVTVSVGVSCASLDDSAAAPDLLGSADRALYQAKAAGRDRCAAVEATGEAAPLVTPDTVAPPVLRSGDLERVLNEGYPFQRFPPAIEAEYQFQRAPGRRRHLFFMAWLGLFCINVYALHSRPMFFDVSDSLVFTMLKVSGILACLSPLLLAPLPGWLREMLYAEGICVAAVAAVYIVSHSTQVTAYSFLTSLLFLPLFAGVVGRQSVLCTLATVVATLGSALVFLNPGDEEQWLVYHDTLFIVGTASLFTLVAACTLERGARRQWLLCEMERLDRSALTAATRRLHELSMKDPLTGLSNRRRFEADFARVWSQAQQEGPGLSLLIIDVDHFKLFNDGYGHSEGDRCLQRIAEVLALAAKEHRGFSARLGGEEFAIILPGQVAAQAAKVAEQACAMVRHLDIEHRHSKTDRLVTISIGVACSRARTGGPRDLLAAADDAVYAAKRAGRDRCMVQQAV
ncbi:MAG: diguanylate cyclase [Rubrivivax sp.]|nr:MAG: diguanylate cyclase [Rubrivivax sp.]